MHRNTRAIRLGAGAALDHLPATVDTREDRVDRINSQYLELCVSRDWLHLQIEVNFPVYANRTGATTSSNVTVTQASTEIFFSSTLGTDFTAAAGGFTFIGPDGETYTIVRFIDEFVARITPVYAGTTVFATDDWTIQAERFYLPRDCTKALRFIDRDNGLGPMQILDRRSRENMAPSLQGSTGTVYWMVDDDMIYDEPPDSGLTLSEDVGAGDFLAGETYEICYTFLQQGRETAPCVPVRYTVATSLKKISVTGITNTRTDSGVFKQFYMRQLTKGENLPADEVYSRWWALGAPLAETTTSFTVAAMPNPSTAITVATLAYTNGRKYMRTEWIPGSDQTLRLRYLRCPPRLVADSDVPQWPEAFHDILLYGLALDLGATQSVSGAKMTLWQNRYDQLLKDFMGAQINVPDAPARRQMRQLGGGWAHRGYRTNGTPTTDFDGG